MMDVPSSLTPSPGPSSIHVLLDSSKELGQVESLHSSSSQTISPIVESNCFMTKQGLT